jgi:hypothetical protein
LSFPTSVATAARPLHICLSLLALAACGAPLPAPAPAPGSPPPGSGAARHAPAAAPLPGLREDLARFAGHENVARGDTLLRILRERGFEPEVQAFANRRPEREPRAEGRNLVVTLGAGDRDIVVGAHSDAVRLPNGRVTGGAVDNGAGAVVLTRVAQTLRGHPLRHRVRVVLFDLEEVGLLGSQAYVEAQAPGRVAAMVNVDIAAYGSTLVHGPSAHEGNAHVYRGFRLVCAVHLLPCLEFPAYPSSDDRSFQAAGIPNISLGIVGAAEAHQMWLLLNAGPEAGLAPGFLPPTLRIIHTAGDTLAHVEAEAMTRMHDAVVALVLELDATL